RRRDANRRRARVPPAGQALATGSPARAERARRRLPVDGGMRRASRRRRAAAMLALALLCGWLATSEVDGRARRIEARVGPLVQVVVARTPLRAGARLDPTHTRGVLEVREVPARFAPPDALASPDEAGGSRL